MAATPADAFSPSQLEEGPPHRSEYGLTTTTAGMPPKNGFVRLILTTTFYNFPAKPSP